MKRFLKKMFPLLLAAAIILSIGWYLFEYDPGFTSDFLLHQARSLEDSGNHSIAVWLYNLAYDHFGGHDAVAIELAHQFKNIGNYSKAEYTLRNAIADGGSVELYTALSKTYVEQGKLRDAVLMLENLSPQMESQLQSLRPAAPIASLVPGSYNQYVSVEIFAPDCQLYVSTDLDYPSADTDAYTEPIPLGQGETTIFAISVAENGLVSPLMVFQYIITDVVEEVVFTDTAFEAAVRQQLDLNSNDLIYSDSLWKVTELNLSEEVLSIADLRWFPNLQMLTIKGAVVDAPNVLSKLHKLQTLSIVGSTLDAASMDAIGALTGLNNLTLSNCSISSVKPLSSLNALSYLDLSNNAIRDVSALSDMHNLLQLNLQSNALINLDDLAELKQLTHLNVSYNSLVSLEPLAAMVNLTELNVNSNSLRSLTGVEQLTALCRFEANYNYLLDIDALAQCLALTYVDVSHNTLLNIDGAVSLNALEELYFMYNEVSKLPAFSTKCALRVINGNNNQLSSLKNLSGLRNLTHIYMDYNPEISSVSSLTKCPVLEELSVYGTKVRDVSALTDQGVLVVYTPGD